MSAEARNGIHRRLLVMNDEDELLRLVVAMLAASGWEIVEAGDLAGAREKLAAGEYDLALLEALGQERASATAPDGKRSLFSYAVLWPARGERFDIKQVCRDMKRTFERRIIRELIRRHGYNKAELARCLSLDYKVLLEKLRVLEAVSEGSKGFSSPDLSFGAAGSS